jgi:hypothetical protein
MYTIVPEFRRLRWKNQELNASLGFITRPCPKANGQTSKQTKTSLLADLLADLWCFVLSFGRL